MNEDHSWEGNWKARLYERVRERGYDSVTAFANERPTASLVALADELGPDDIAGVQVLNELRSEAEQRNQLPRFVRDVLVRMLSQSLPKGWPAVLDDANRFKVAKAIGRWFAYIPETHKAHADRAGDALLASPPLPGWRPLGPDDALLLALLPDEDV